MQEIVLIAHPLAEASEVRIVETVGLYGVVHARRDQAPGGQRFAVDEVVVRATQRTGRQRTELVAVLKQVEQIGPFLEHAPAEFRAAEAPEPPGQRRSRHRVDDLEHPRGVPRIRDQLPQGPGRDQRARPPPARRPPAARPGHATSAIRPVFTS